MDINKFIKGFFAIFIAISLSFSAIAENDTQQVVTTALETEVQSNETAVVEGGIEVVDEKDANILSTQLGSKVRLLQLKKVLTVQIELSDYVLTYLNDYNKSESVDMVRLEEIRNQLETLLVGLDELNLEQDANVLADEFVQIKSDVIALSKEFKDLVSVGLTEEERQVLRELLNEKKKEEFNNKDASLEAMKKEFVSNQIQEKLNAFGINPGQIMAQIRSGELNESKIRELVKANLNGLNPKARIEVQRKAQLNNNQTLNEARLRIEDMGLKVKARSEEREDDLREKFEIRKDDIKLKVEQRKDKLRVEFRNKLTGERFEIKDGEIRYRDENVRYRLDEDGEMRIRAARDDVLVEIGGIELTKIKVDVRSDRETEVEIERFETTVKEFEVSSKLPAEIILEIANELGVSPAEIRPYIDLRVREGANNPDLVDGKDKEKDDKEDDSDDKEDESEEDEDDDDDSNEDEDEEDDDSDDDDSNSGSSN